MREMKKLTFVQMAEIAYEACRVYRRIATGEERMGWDELCDVVQIPERTGRPAVQLEWIKRVKDLHKKGGDEPDPGNSNETLVESMIVQMVCRIGRITREGIAM